MRKRFILQPGKICTIDPNNVANQTTEGITRVVIVKEIPTSIFKQRKFLVKPICDNGEIEELPFETNEEFLFPDGMMVIRTPSNIPVLNNMDLDAVETAVKMLDAAFNFLSPDKKKLTIGCIERLGALKEKFKYYMKIKEV